MTHDQIKLLIDSMHKLVRAEVTKQTKALHKQMQLEMKQQVSALRKQMLSESSRQSSMQDLTIKPVKRPPTTNPYLQEIFASLDPHQLDETPQPGKIPVPTTDFDGKPINYDNPAVHSVLEAMTRRYDEFVEAKPPAAAVQQPQIKQPQINPFNEEW